MGRKIRYGEIYESDNYGKFVPIEYVGGEDDRIKIKFINTGYITTVTSNALVHGKVKDKYLPTIAGIGYIGDFEGKISYPENIMFYKVWNDMLHRCYNKNDKDFPLYGLLGISVDPRWFSFKNFFDDVKLLPNYNKKIKYPNQYQLDKDYLQLNIPKQNRIYSRYTCMWISKHDNCMIMTRENNNNKYYGVSEIRNGIYKARYSNYSIGYFNNEIAAANAFNYYYTLANQNNIFSDILILNDVPYMPPQEFFKYNIHPKTLAISLK